MPNHLMLLAGHRVEDRTTYAGEGTIVDVSPATVIVEFDDGSRESIKPELFSEINDGYWRV
jgi:hypothetical protein